MKFKLIKGLFARGGLFTKEKLCVYQSLIAQSQWLSPVFAVVQQCRARHWRFNMKRYPIRDKLILVTLLTLASTGWAGSQLEGDFELAGFPASPHQFYALKGFQDLEEAEFKRFEPMERALYLSEENVALSEEDVAVIGGLPASPHQKEVLGISEEGWF
jgi:hypothetical protein